MSALLLVLPRVQAAAERVLSCRSPFPTERKGPHRLRLLHAAEAVPTPAQPLAVCPAPEPELAFYRKYTEALLRRYLRLALDAGRVPSLLGREVLRGEVTHARARFFEDAVIFVLDVERCIARISPGRRHLLRRIALQEYTQGETAAMLGLSLRTVVRRYAEALDQLTRLLLERDLLGVLSSSALAESSPVENSCQAPEPLPTPVTSSWQTG